MVLTPQLLQAIKLLQMPNAELSAFIEDELERNPLLERAEDARRGRAGSRPSRRRRRSRGRSRRLGERNLEADPAALARKLGTEIENTFDPDRAATPAERRAGEEGQAFPRHPGAGVGGRGDGELSRRYRGLCRRARVLGRVSDPAGDDRARPIPIERMIAAALIDAIDEAGYLTGSLAEIAERLGAPLAQVEAVLELLQTLEPTGVFARNLAECLKLQLIERDRFDPAMQAMIENLPALAKRDMRLSAPRLRRRRRGPRST